MLGGKEEMDIKEEIFDQTSDIKEEMTSADSKHEIYSFCTDAEKCKSEMLDPDCKGVFCDYILNTVYSDASGNQPDKNMVCETTDDSDMLATGTDQQNSEGR